MFHRIRMPMQWAQKTTQKEQIAFVSRNRANYHKKSYLSPDLSQLPPSKIWSPPHQIHIRRKSRQLWRRNLHSHIWSRHRQNPPKQRHLHTRCQISQHRLVKLLPHYTNGKRTTVRIHVHSNIGISWRHQTRIQHWRGPRRNHHRYVRLATSQNPRLS